MTYFKVFTSGLRSPVQGGEPIWDGALPFLLPIVEVDTSGKECSHGWNVCRDLSTALRIAGLWPDGRPSRAYRLSAVDGHEAIERGDKVRAATWEIVSEVSGAEIERTISDWTRTWAGEHSAAMAVEQIAWSRALARPGRDEQAVVAGLEQALAARGLG